MYTIHVHYPCFECYMDAEISHVIRMPFVPRVGDDIFIDAEEYEQLERMIEQNERLSKKYRRWVFGGDRCSFDDAMTVIEVSYRNSSKEIHIELGESINEKDSREY